MGQVELLLTAALVRIDAVDPSHRHAQHCVDQYFAELDRRFDAGFDPAASLPAELDELRPPDGLFLVATLHGEPIGSGALKFHGAEPAELKRMWVDANARGLGVGRRLLEELEQRAAAGGSDTIRLETNQALTEAIGLYRSAGYRRSTPSTTSRTLITGSRSTSPRGRPRRRPEPCRTPRDLQPSSTRGEPRRFIIEPPAPIGAAAPDLPEDR